MPLRDAQPLDNEAGRTPGTPAAQGYRQPDGGRTHRSGAHLRRAPTCVWWRPWPTTPTLALRNGWLINGLTHAVRHDALTGLVNRSYLHQQLSNVLGGDPLR